MYGTYELLHVSVFLFFWALNDFFYTVHHPFGLVIRYILVAAAIFYSLLSIAPLIFSNSPYNTPMTPPLRAACIILRIIIRSPSLCLRWYNRQSFDLTGLKYYKGIHFDRARLYSIKAETWAKKLEPFAMNWLFTEADFSDDDMDRFLEGLPGYMSSDHTNKDKLDQYLTAEPILNRIKEHFITCATSVELSDEASLGRVSSCVKALLRISRYSRECKETVPDNLIKEYQRQQTYNQELIDVFQRLCGIGDPTIALRASCIRALAVQGLLSQLVSQNRTTDGPQPPFHASLIPIYQFFFPYDNTDNVRDQLHQGLKPSDEENQRMWTNLLHDGPLANLTKLSQAIRKKEQAPLESLSFCWKTLDKLLKQLGTLHSEDSTPAQIEFDTHHESIRKYVSAGEQGFRITPLLNILDTVARGRRLLMVFSGHTKYHDRADIVFGKEYLQNGDLLEAFAHCLPDFISKHRPEVCKEFMENVVDHDDLWTSLQVNLWNAQKSDSPTTDKLRVFEDCCTVIDLAFSALEDSQNVDWRAPEFGSLAQHFESFITHYFQGAFMGRAISFRVGLIKARFCNAILTQFWNDLDREGTLSFRSQWDVACLARVIYTLGLRDKDDPEFWDSYIDGGHIGAEFTGKAVEMIKLAECDGPLLIFYHLGRLASAALPLDQSGLDLKDIESVLKLQKKVIKNKRLPLNRASEMVWEALSQLRQQVNDLYGKNNVKDKDILQSLLCEIDDVYNLRYEEIPIQSEPAEEQDPNTSAAANSASSSGDSRAIPNRLSSVSESTAATGGLSGDSQTREGEDGLGRESSLLIPWPCTDSQTVRSVADRRSESPQSYDSGFHSIPSLYSTTQGTSGSGIVSRSIGMSPSTISPVTYVPRMRDARRRTSMPARRTSSEFSLIRPSLAIRANTTGTQSTFGRDALPNPAIGSPHGSSDHGDLPCDEGQSGVESSSSPPSGP